MPVRPPNLFQADMAKVKGCYTALYQRQEPTTPGILVPTHATPCRINYEVPMEGEAEAAVQRI